MPIHQGYTKGAGGKSNRNSKPQKKIDQRNERIADAYGKEMDKHQVHTSWADDKGNRYSGAEPKSKASAKALRKLSKKGHHGLAVEKGILKAPRKRKKKKGEK